uniref:Uncharacterized protein n=1 Tax=Arundo donax TaxID=35708 RepID=A0A0A9BRX3_ARUDO
MQQTSGFRDDLLQKRCDGFCLWVFLVYIQTAGSGLVCEG